MVHVKLSLVVKRFFAFAFAATVLFSAFASLMPGKALAEEVIATFNNPSGVYDIKPPEGDNNFPTAHIKYGGGASNKNGLATASQLFNAPGVNYVDDRAGIDISLDAATTKLASQDNNRTLGFINEGKVFDYFLSSVDSRLITLKGPFTYTLFVDVCDPASSLRINGPANVKNIKDNWFGPNGTLAYIKKYPKPGITDNIELMKHVDDALANNNGVSSTNGSCGNGTVITSDATTKSIEVTLDLPEQDWANIVKSNVQNEYPQWFEYELVTDDGHNTVIARQNIYIPDVIGKKDGKVTVVFQSDAIVMGQYKIVIFDHSRSEDNLIKRVSVLQQENDYEEKIDGLYFFDWLKSIFPAGIDKTTPPANGGSDSTFNVAATSLTGGDSTIGADGTSDAPTCETSGFTLSWVLCPIINGLTTLSEGIFNTVIVPYLKTSPISTENSDSNTTYKIWSNFRTIGNILLIFGLLFIVFGQAIGGGMVDAYTAKKALPRILVAAILINLSIYLVAIAVDIFNVLGAGLGALITAPLKSIKAYNFSVGDGTAGTVGAVVGVAALLGWLLYQVTKGGHFQNGLLGKVNPFRAGVAGSAGVGGTSPLPDPNASTVATGGTGHPFLQFFLLFVLLPIVIVTISIFVTLIIRRGLIMFLVIISPVALALYCLPQTEKYARKWLKTLMEALVVYPIVVGLFALAYVLSLTIISANGGLEDTGLGSQLFAKLIGIVVLFIPLALIPFAFKFAGGVLSSAYGTITDRGKKGHEAIKGNANDPNSMRNRVKRGASEGMNRRAQRYVDSGRVSGASRFRTARRRLVQGALGNIDQKNSAYNKQRSQQREDLMSTGRDELVYAAGGWLQQEDSTERDPNNGALPRYLGGQHYDSKGRAISKALYQDGQRLYGGGNTNAGGAAFEYALRKAQTDPDVSAMRQAFTQQSIANNWNEQEMGDVWAAATYPHKDKFATEWYSSPKRSVDSTGRTNGVTFADVGSDEGSYGKLAGDYHKTREQFKLSSLRDVDLRAMATHQERLTQRMETNGPLTVDEAKNFAMTDEILQSMVSEGMVTMDAEGKPQAIGFNAASKGVVEAMFNNQRFTTIKSHDGASPAGDPLLSTSRVDIVPLINNPNFGATQFEKKKIADRSAPIRQNVKVRGEGDRSEIAP